MTMSIAPGFLVAAPQLKDPFFQRTVVFMMEHNVDEGALGLIINQTADVKLESVMRGLDLEKEVDNLSSKHPPVMFGGPVSPELGWIIHSVDWTSKQTRVYNDMVAVTASMELLKAIFSGNGPKDYLFCLGYSGWGPHQLIGEMRTGSWLNVPFERKLVFDVPIESRWNEAIGRLGIDPGCIAPVVGDA